MQKTSALYQTEVQKPFAGQALLRITFGLTDTDAAATCGAPETTPGAAWSRPGSMLYEEGAPKTCYATFEPGRLRVGTGQLILPREQAARRAEGFVSAALCGADGTFAAGQQPVVALRFSKTHTVPGLTLTFDAPTGDFPAAVQLTALRGKEVLLEREYAPNAAVFTTPDAIERFDGLELRFIRMAKPFRRARLGQILFGFGLVFTGAQLRQASHSMELDPIGRRLPINRFSFTIVNANTLTGAQTGTSAQYVYDPENLEGVYRYISAQNPVKVEYGQQLPDGMRWGDAEANSWGELELNGWREVHEGGVTEWVPGGRFWLTAQPTVDDMQASFSAQDALAGLTAVYTEGVYAPEGRSLYDLAQQLLEAAALPRLDANEPPWRLWEGLRAVKTTAPLPAKAQREVLQLIAHAGRCALYTDRTGCICMQPLGAQREDFLLDFNAMYARPKVSQIPTLRAVECPAYRYIPAEKTTQLYSGTHAVFGESALALSFPQAAEVSVRVEGAQAVRTQLYAGAAQLVLRGGSADAPAQARVTVTGRKLERAKRVLCASVLPVGGQGDGRGAGQPDENGSVETLDNPLITNDTNALEVAQWVRDYLLLRNTYEVSYRGSPELEVGDVIALETQFAPFHAPARVLKSELKFNGSLQGKITAKRMVNT